MHAKSFVEGYFLAYMYLLCTSNNSKVIVQVSFHYFGFHTVYYISSFLLVIITLFMMKSVFIMMQNV